jgi:hypothetical protein
MPVRQKKSMDDALACPRDHEKLEDYCREGEFTNEAMARPFLREIKKLMDCARQHGTSPDEVVLMLSYSVGVNSLRLICWDQFKVCLDIICQFVGDEKYKLFDPPFYARLKQERIAVAEEAAETGVDEKTISLRKASRAIEALRMRSKAVAA